MSKSFADIKKEIEGVYKEMGCLDVKMADLKRQLQKKCTHPKGKSYKTGAGTEVCHKCEKILKSWPVHVSSSC